MYSGMVFEGMFKAWKQDLSGGGIVAVLEQSGRSGVTRRDSRSLHMGIRKLETPCCRAVAATGLPRSGDGDY